MGRSSTGVLPASAGMIPAQQVGWHAGLRAPRIRGDDPRRPELPRGRNGCSPHPRG